MAGSPLAFFVNAGSFEKNTLTLPPICPNETAHDLPKNP
jgi:hypothetical protein